MERWAGIWQRVARVGQINSENSNVWHRFKKIQPTKGVSQRNTDLVCPISGPTGRKWNTKPFSAGRSRQRWSQSPEMIGDWLEG